MIFKIDLDKTYDKIEWPFLLTILKDFKFPNYWISLIHECLSSNTMSVLWNGSTLPAIFVPRRSLRLGDPLSPCLLICALHAKLSNLILEKVDSKNGLELKHPDLAHLNAKNYYYNLIKDVLSVFCGFSGLRISLNKSKIFVSPNISI